MIILKSSTRYEARASYEDRHVLKAAGWAWDPRGKAWWTGEAANVERLRREVAPAELEVLEESGGIELDLPTTWENHPSCATDGPMDIPCPPGLVYLPYQRGGIAYARGRDGVLIADEPGLGKTIQAIGILNDEPVRTALVIVPASLKINWQREFDKWLNYYLPVHVVMNAKLPFPQKVGVVIVNYDIVAKLRPRLDLVEWDALICDESHLMKNPETKRAMAVVGKNGRGGISARRRIFLTGTPLESRPAEIFTAANALRPDVFPSWLDFAFRYCAARMTPYGLDARGSSNSAELQAKLRTTVMIRRKKADVLKDLPDKIQQRILLPCDKKLKERVIAEKAAYERERAIFSRLRESGADAGRLQAARAEASARMRDLRIATTEGKMPMALEFLRSAACEEKIIVFAVHHLVLDLLSKEFGEAAVRVDGKVAIDDRQRAVDRFQSDPECRVFIGQIAAAGVGLTLTASSHVCFVEFDWRPGMLTQAEDRAHRIGQKNCVNVSYLVIEDSLDDVQLASVAKKQETLSRTLDVQ
jgi:SWI/SNF-related matrix-associated actin-dependent regulator 1 of chromatin subfamily A